MDGISEYADELRAKGYDVEIFDAPTISKYDPTALDNWDKASAKAAQDFLMANVPANT